MFWERADKSDSSVLTERKSVRDGRTDRIDVQSWRDEKVAAAAVVVVVV